MRIRIRIRNTGYRYKDTLYSVELNGFATGFGFFSGSVFGSEPDPDFVLREVFVFYSYNKNIPETQYRYR
jgi:hypothetical protein